MASRKLLSLAKHAFVSRRVLTIVLSLTRSLNTKWEEQEEHLSYVATLRTAYTKLVHHITVRFIAVDCK